MERGSVAMDACEQEKIPADIADKPPSPGSSKPQRPDDIHQCVGGCRRQQSAPITPCAAVENPGNGRQHYVAPIEGQRLVEMGEPEDHGGYEQRARVTYTCLEQILQQAPKEQLFWDGNEDECDQQRSRRR